MSVVLGSDQIQRTGGHMIYEDLPQVSLACLREKPCRLSLIMRKSTGDLAEILRLDRSRSSPCIFFQLAGVTEANPVAPVSAWFAIDKNQGNAKEMYALLVAVKMAGSSAARVQTTGEIVCGQAKVGTIDL